MSEPRSIESTISQLKGQETSIKALWTDFLALIKNWDY